MDVKSCIKYLCIFYGILVIFLGLGVHYINGGEIKDCENSIGEPVVFKGG